MNGWLKVLLRRNRRRNGLRLRVLKSMSIRTDYEWGVQGIELKGPEYV